jgi:hypothetical protein
LTFNGLHDVISQKPELFITTAVRTSNQTRNNLILFFRAKRESETNIEEMWRGE